MTNDEFLNYCEAHATTPRCGFVPEQLARLCRLAGRSEEAGSWDRHPHGVVNCREHVILGLVEFARDRMS